MSYAKSFEVFEVLSDIKEWNAETFPDATLAGQLAKLEEEFEEHSKAEGFESKKKELADIFIVLGGLMRWNSRVGKFIATNILDIMLPEAVEGLLEDIKAKMEVNKERTRKGLWKKQPDGSYHH